jgi:DNA-binding NarL/FixJ family response regulator
MKRLQPVDQINIAVVDDHELFREGITLVLKQIRGFNIVCTASSGHAFLQYLQTSKPDVVLMDINMPGMNGVETTIKAREQYPELNVIALTMFSDTLHSMQMIEAGVKGFVLKKGNKNELRQAVTDVFNGGNYFSQEILQGLASRSLRNPRGDDQFTVRELEVLDLVCRGLTSQEIADKLFISAKTVEGHRTNIFQKANVRNTAALVLWALRNNFLTLE